jgi:hypothetical protein
MEVEEVEITIMNKTFHTTNKLRGILSILLLIIVGQACSLSSSKWQAVFSAKHLSLSDLRQEDGSFVIGENWETLVYYFHNVGGEIGDPQPIPLPSQWRSTNLCLSDKIWVVDDSGHVGAYDALKNEWLVQDELFELHPRDCSASSGERVILWGNTWFSEWDGVKFGDPILVGKDIAEVKRTAPGDILILTRSGEIYQYLNQNLIFWSKVPIDTKYGSELSIPSNSYDTIWVSTWHELYKWSALEFEPELVLELNQVESSRLNVFRGIYQDSKNNIWIITTYKIYSYNNQNNPFPIDLPGSMGAINGSMFDQTRERLYLLTQKGIFFTSVEQLEINQK